MCTIRFLSHVCVKDLHQSRNDLTKKMLSAGEIRWDHVISCLWNVIISAVKMMMWFMDTIYKMVVSQHIYIYISYCTVPCYIHVWYCMITNSSDFGFLFCSVLSNKINEKQLNEEFLLKIASAKSHWEELEKYVFLLLYSTLVTWLHLKHPYMQILFRGEDLLYL